MPSSRDLPDPEVEPTPLTSPALAGRFFTTGKVLYLGSPSQNHAFPNTATLSLQTGRKLIGFKSMKNPNTEISKNYLADNWK